MSETNVEVVKPGDFIRLRKAWGSARAGIYRFDSVFGELLILQIGSYSTGVPQAAFVDFEKLAAPISGRELELEALRFKEHSESWVRALIKGSDQIGIGG